MAMRFVGSVVEMPPLSSPALYPAVSQAVRLGAEALREAIAALFAPHEKTGASQVSTGWKTQHYGMSSIVFTNSKTAMWIDRGTKKDYEIRAKRGTYLRLEFGGEADIGYTLSGERVGSGELEFDAVYVKAVTHPGIQARGYVAKAERIAKPLIMASIEEAATASLAGALPARGGRYNIRGGNPLNRGQFSALRLR